MGQSRNRRIPKNNKKMKNEKKEREEKKKSEMKTAYVVLDGELGSCLTETTGIYSKAELDKKMEDCDLNEGDVVLEVKIIKHYTVSTEHQTLKEAK
jgi:hypothetical protein